MLILLSDGEHNIDFADQDRQPLKPRQAASLAANLGITIYTIDTRRRPAQSTIRTPPSSGSRAGR